MIILPDESCRRCGGMLLDYSVCAKCRAPTVFICRICGRKTDEQFHESICFREEVLNNKYAPVPKINFEVN